MRDEGQVQLHAVLGLPVHPGPQGQAFKDPFRDSAETLPTSSTARLISSNLPVARSAWTISALRDRSPAAGTDLRRAGERAAQQERPACDAPSGVS